MGEQSNTCVSAYRNWVFWSPMESRMDTINHMSVSVSEGGAGVSIHDEQEIERLRANRDSIARDLAILRLRYQTLQAELDELKLKMEELLKK